jgi:hypothetical protein
MVGFEMTAHVSAESNDDATNELFRLIGTEFSPTEHEITNYDAQQLDEPDRYRAGAGVTIDGPAFLRSMGDRADELLEENAPSGAGLDYITAQDAHGDVSCRGIYRQPAGRFSEVPLMGEDDEYPRQHPVPDEAVSKVTTELKEMWGQPLPVEEIYIQGNQLVCVYGGRLFQGTPVVTESIGQAVRSYAPSVAWETFDTA